MQVVIEMSDDYYEILKYEGQKPNAHVFSKLVANGTVLPKGHGDLKDATDLLKMTESYKSELGRLKADPFVKSGIETVESFIRDSSTIIEADRSEE